MSSHRGRQPGQEGSGAGLSGQDEHALRAAAGRAKALVIGALNIDYIITADRLPGDDGSVVATSTCRPGGHAGNCAAALARLGVHTDLMGAVGRDPDGASLLEELAGLGVGVGHVAVSGTPTGKVFIPTFPGHRFMLMDRGANETVGSRQLERVPLAEFDAVLVFDPPAQVLGALAEAVSPLSRRPVMLWNPGGIYSRPEYLHTARSDFDMLAINRDEKASMLGGSHGALPPARDGHELITTLGPGGSRLEAGASAVTAPAYAVQVTDLTGAGDSYCAAAVLGRLAGLPAMSRLRLANAVGGLATRGVGARGSLPDLDEALWCTRHQSVLAQTAGMEPPTPA